MPSQRGAKMKTGLKISSVLAISLGILSGISGCSSMPGSSVSGEDIAPTGPTVMNVRTEPSTVELNRELRPFQKPEILADVKDFGAKVEKVTLKFTHVPIQVPMKNVGGTTWRAELSQEQLKMLAVSGKTIKYDTLVEAQDEKGRIGMSSSPTTVAIKAPDLSRRTT